LVFEDLGDSLIDQKEDVIDIIGLDLNIDQLLVNKIDIQSGCKLVGVSPLILFGKDLKLFDIVVKISKTFLTLDSP
jgi:hypothetical protein